MNAESPNLKTTSGLSDENPWPGLLPFGEEDGKYFHGRDFESEMLHRRLERERLTILFAPSGLGKSSILRAGLFPILRKENVLPVYIRLNFSEETPELAAQVKAAIVAEADRVGVEAPTPTAKETLWEFLHRKDAEFWSARHQLMRPLLVFDQFEEVFTLGARDLARAHQTTTFLTELADLVEARPPLQLRSRLEMETPDRQSSEAERFHFEHHRYKVLLSLREDFLPELESLGERMGSVAHNRFRLGRMNGVAALQVVGQSPEIIAPDVGERIVRFVAASDKHDALVDLEVEPALLSVVCNELNTKRLEDGEERITEQTLLGSQRQVLSDFYERSITDLSEPVRTFVEEKLLTRHGFRNLVVYDDAISAPEVTEDDIEELIRRRLVRVEERGRLRLLELSHDLLIGVVTASRDERRRRAREAEAVRKVEEQLVRSRKRAVASLLVLVLAMGALGGLAWAYFAQQQADALAVERDRAERAAQEASRQRQIAETQRLAAEQLQLDAERAREQAETAAEEASRQQMIADSQRVLALSERQDAMSARADAETAADEALVQRNLAEQQRRLAEDRQSAIAESQKQVEETNEQLVVALQERLASRDADEVLGALDILVGNSQDSASVLAQVDDAWFGTVPDFIPLLQALDRLADEQPHEKWSSLRVMLARRLSAVTRYRAPLPSSAVERVRIGGAGIQIEGASRPVRVPSFELQRFEVTNDEYRLFDPRHAPDAPGNHPVTHVNWFEAMAYAAWLGGTLPSEAQWQLAAAGAGGRDFPWGDTPPSQDLANFTPRGAPRGTAQTRAVGSFPLGATPEGTQDLAGNVWEWCRDGSSASRVLKGGSYFNDEGFLPSSRRNRLHPEASEAVVGFRVVWIARTP